MEKKMLIDASHPEETRVVIVDGNRVEELDFESSNKLQIRGNVYLARVGRVEPSLQAAFVEYGGNKSGFLALSEIHPDYYQIPHEDKLALLESEAAEQESENLNDDENEEEDASVTDQNTDPDSDDISDENDEEVAIEQVKVAHSRRKRQSKRRYKIQEVIKRGQILLIQAVKEERGNKGAAMTTYLSLAGRYCVLMPNTARGGGISRKIAISTDRKRLKTIMNDLEVPKGMGVIVRTAGAKRTKAEIKRDFEYLSRLWSEIRDTTLKSIAPNLIHEEGNLVKRSIRDMYNKDIEEVLIQGENAYKTAKAFMKMLMPSHAKNVKSYKDKIPLFLRYNVERQIENSLKSIVQLKSGGYLVIHPTEALVSVDVNSGRSTKERNVERTALKTNIEAAEEVARQMRLRDLAGLIVIDFIDMDEHKNNRAVERTMKNALTRDRARVQTSKISQFGLMEISRQRKRRSLLEGSTAHCEHCEGVGRKRSIESSALTAIRAVEEYGVRGKAKRILLKVSKDVALYLFNEKRELLQKIDKQSGLFTELVGDDQLIRPQFEIELLEKSSNKAIDPLEAIEKEFLKQKTNKIKKIAATPNVDEKMDGTAYDKEEHQGNEVKKKRKRRRGRKDNTSKSQEDALESSNIAEEGSLIQSKSEINTPPSDTDSSEPKEKQVRSGRRRAPKRKEDITKLNPKNKIASKTKEDKEKEVISDKNTKHKEKNKTKIKAGRRKAPLKKKADEGLKPSSPLNSDKVVKKPIKPKDEASKTTTKMKSKTPARRKAPQKPLKKEEEKQSKATSRKKSLKKLLEQKEERQGKVTARKKAPPKKTNEPEKLAEEVSKKPKSNWFSLKKKE
ncbi:Rne/Rng family ribonuclease [Hellea sp.]|nr:Rne/Rng family ribonuclease [Hellea sp.]MDA8888293.1 Rne/Rng family ribonuclease [Hellea sp.]MDB4844538.1 Rne/Rng family ribonuclease [Hellea sp.]MDC1062487.1 Rne/Rng family ribonuclease [Hellea sp.]